MSIKLKSDLDALKSKKPRTFKDWLSTADEEDKQIVLDAINDESIPPNSLAMTLRENDVPITWDTIAKLRGTL